MLMFFPYQPTLIPESIGMAKKADTLSLDMDSSPASPVRDELPVKDHDSDKPEDFL